MLRPSYTYGRIPTLRQTGFDLATADRLRRNLPVAVSDDAETIQWQALDHRDAGRAFALLTGRRKAIGQVVNVVGDEHFSWAELHRIAADAIGAPPPRLVPLPRERILAQTYPGSDLFREITAYDGWYDNTRLHELLPELGDFIPYREGILRNIQWLEERGELQTAVPGWEDELLVGSATP